MAGSRPYTALVLAVVAGSTLLVLTLAPTTPWLAPDVQPLALTLAAGWASWRLLALDRALAHRRAWRQAPGWTLSPEALPTETTPAWWPGWLRRWWSARHRHHGILLGRAFRWHAGHTQRLETALATEGALPIAEDSRGGHPALHAVGQETEQPLIVPWSELVGHVLVTGTTRSGKTRLLEVLASEAIRGTGAVVVLDPKGDRELLARCAAEAHRHSRPFALITPAFPEQSARMNVLDTATTPAEVSARIYALMPSAGARANDPFFEQYPLAFIEHVASVQQALGQAWTLESLYKASVLRPHMEALLTDYLLHLGFSGPRGLKQLINHYRHTGTSDLTADALIEDWEHDPDHFRKVTSNLIPAFRGIIGAPLGPLFSAIPAEITWTRILQEQMTVYVSLASLLLGEIANRIGRIIVQDLVGMLGRRYAYENVTEVAPITVIIDEVGDVVYPLFINALNKGGGAQARFILAQQSFADLESAIGKAPSRRVFDNLNTKIYFRVADDYTAAEATEGLGTCTVHLPDTAVGLSYGGVGGLSGSSHRRLQSRETPLIRPTWLTALPRGEAFLRMKGELFKLRVPLLSPVPQHMLDQLGLTDLWKGLEPPPVV